MVERGPICSYGCIRSYGNSMIVIVDLSTSNNSLRNLVIN